MKVLTASEMREVDRLTSERYGIPGLQLMEAAGASVAAAVRRMVVANEVALDQVSVCVLCGKGNNGGDGFVAARHLQEAGVRVRVHLFGEVNEVKGDAATNLQRWVKSGGNLVNILNEESWTAAWPEVVKADVIVDGLLGTGLRGPATGLIARAIENVNSISRNATAPRPSFIVSVDTPSGLPSDGEAARGPVLYAHRTVTFTAPKVGQLISPNCAAVGSLEVANIGSPPELIEEIGQGKLRWIEAGEFKDFPLVRAVNSHKGTFGHVLVIGGSLGKSGAAALSGRAALRSGAGLVTVATPERVLPMVAAVQAEYMTEVLEATSAGTASIQNLEGRFAEIEKGKTEIAIGPGLGTHPETQEFIRRIVQQTQLPVVLDADGLNAFAENADELNRRKSKFLAITPHPGEMARLLRVSTKTIEEDRVKTATQAAERWNVGVVLKGFHTIVATPDGQIFVNTTGNAGLAKGGSGDVLTGVLAALTGQFGTQNWARVLALGVYLHGLAAELATQGTDISGLLAGEVADAIPDARRRVLLELQRGA
jgi:NAD(P)H-hydrate epimerase